MAFRSRLFLVLASLLPLALCQVSASAQGYGMSQPVTNSQTQTGGSAQKDPAAVAFIQQSLHASGADAWSNVRDYEITATATQWAFVSRQWPMIICGRSGGGYRVEVDGDAATGSLVEISDGLHGQLTGSKSSGQALPEHYIVSLPIYFPIPFLADLVSNPQVSIVDKGLVTVDGGTARQIDVSKHFAQPNNSHDSYLDHSTQRSLFFDPNTGFLLRISDYLYSARYPSSKLSRVTVFTDYRTDQGITFPHVVEERVEPRVYRAIEVKSIQLNPGLPAAAFALQQ